MHRVAYQVYYKDDLTPNDVICHKCDNPACVNPKHLFKGTHQDNVQDKVNKGSDFITIRYYKEYSNYWQARSAQRNIGGY